VEDVGNFFLNPITFPTKAYPEIFRGMGFKNFLHRREIFGGFEIFFLKNTIKLKKIRKRGGCPQKPIPEYTSVPYP